MGFARVPLWDKYYSLIGFRLSASDGLDEEFGSRYSLWSAMEQLGLSTLRQHKGSASAFFAWELCDKLWSQAAEVAHRHPYSFEQWCRTLRESQISLISPAGAANRDIEMALGLAQRLAGQSVPLFNSNFSLDTHSIALSSKSSGVFIDARTHGFERCSTLCAKFTAAGKIACIDGIDHAASTRVIVDTLPSATMSGMALWDQAGTADYHAMRRFEPSTAKLIEALALAFDDADISQVEEAIESDVALAFKFISLLNTAALRTSKQEIPGIGSVRQGIMLMGRQALIQWLSVLLLRIGQHKPEQTALRWCIAARSRLCENLARRSNDATLQTQAFICGMMSGLPAVLAISPLQLASQCPLPTPLAQAINHGRGPLGELLALAIQCERPSGLDIDSQTHLTKLGLDRAALNDARKEAFRWAWSCV
jgi:hypothetical protein